MAAGATFEPSQGADPIGAIQSYMQRAQNYRAQQQQMDQQKAEFQAKLPVIQAAAQANIASAQASISNATRLEQLRAQAAAESPGFNNEFIEATQLQDFTMQSAALSQLQAKVAYMSLLPEYKGFVDTVNKARVDAHGSAIADLKLQDQTDAATAAAQARIEAAQIAAGAKTTNAATYSSSRERIAQINADTKLSVEDKRAAKQGIQLSDLQNRAAEAEQMAADAQRDGDTQSAAAHRAAAASYRDAIQKTTTFAGSTPSAPKDASQDVRPTPRPSSSISPPALNLSGLTADGSSSAPQDAPAVAPTKVPKDATTVKVGDKEYPIFKDRNGNRAYKIDGHYVPIQSE
jgi:trimeric autotransporter adhesin